MKTFSWLMMGLGFLVTLSSTLFTIIERRYDALPIVFFWILLTTSEIFSLWIWLFSRSTTLQPTQRLVLLSLLGVTIVWIIMVFINPDGQSIFIWALKTLNNSGLFFLGLIVYYRIKKKSSAIE